MRVLINLISLLSVIVSIQALPIGDKADVVQRDPATYWNTPVPVDIPIKAPHAPSVRSNLKRDDAEIVERDPATYWNTPVAIDVPIGRPHAPQVRGNLKRDDSSEINERDSRTYWENPIPRELGDPTGPDLSPNL